MAAVPIKKPLKWLQAKYSYPCFQALRLPALHHFIPLAFWNSLIGHFMFFLPITLIITLLASLVVAYIMNPVFAVDFMKPHYEGEHDHPKFDRKVVRALIFLAISAVV